MRAAWRDLAPPRRVDLVIAAGLLAWGLPDVPWWWEPSGHAGSTPNVLGSLALTLAMSVPFFFRRAFPVPVLAAAGSVLAIRAGLGRNEISAFAAVLVGAYGLGAYSVANRRYARWLGLITLALAVVTVAAKAGQGDRLAAVPVALLGAAFVLGDAASARRGEMAAAVEAAHQAERTRIARELHDVVAHQLSAITVQAGAARMAAATADRGAMAAGPEPARLGGPGGLGTAAEVLATVEQLSREALAELSHLLGALRREPSGQAGTPPVPTLAELGTLIEAARAAGVEAELSIDGPARRLSPGAELSCYRIVSEALANVTRHAPGAAATVAVRYRAHALELQVRNAAPPHPPRHAAPAGGLGIRGMRERAELYGGALTAGPEPAGGFLVTAVIPDGGTAGAAAAADEAARR